MGEVVILSLTAALNPTLVAITTLMLLLPHPQRLMFGFWLGAMISNITISLVVVFALEGTGAVSTGKHTVSPIEEIGLAVIFAIPALVLATGRDKPYRERRAKKREDKKREAKKTPRWKRTLEKGSAKTAFVVGAFLNLPDGVSALAALDRLTHLHYAAWITVLVVIGFNLVQLVLLEVPMLAFKVAPDWTPAAIDRAKAWIRVHGRGYLTAGLAIAAGIFAVKGIVGLL